MPVTHSNIAVLTKSSTVYAKKKRAKRDEIKEIIFDDDNRREFLTGFRKRKLQRIEEKKNKRLEREKKERLETRREQRQILAEQAIKNATEIEAAYGAHLLDEADEADWEGISLHDKGKEEEFEDEEQLATVTVIEDFDPSELIHGPPPDHPPISYPPPDPAPEKTLASSKTKRSTKKSDPKKVRYETKAARAVEKKKQRSRKLEKAERAGGKASRAIKGKRNHATSSRKR